MKPVVKLSLTIALLLAMMVFTICCYVFGKMQQTSCLMLLAVLCFPLLNIINLLIKELKK